MNGRHVKIPDADLRYMAAHEALWRNAAAERAAGIGHGTPAHLILELEALEAAKAVRWWRHVALNGRVMRKLAREGVRP